MAFYRGLLCVYAHSLESSLYGNPSRESDGRFNKVVFSETEIYLAEIQIAPDFQKQGIGSSLIQSVIQQAEINNKKLWLKVLKGNPAKKLYERFGFRKIQESSTHKIMSREFKKGCK